MNKAIDTKKKIHSCSPFCVAFKIQNIDELDARIDDYINAAQVYCESENHKKWTELFRKYAIENLIKLSKEVMSKVIEEQTEKEKRFKLSDKYYIHHYLENMSITDYETVHNKYLAPKVFNKEEFNIRLTDGIYGVSDYLTGYNSKKIFLQHQTATFNISNRFRSDEAMLLYQFSKLQDNKLLPNPLPVFIEKEELNDEVVKIFNREGEKKISYSEIIEEVFSRKQDLGNYYLFNFFGKTVRDFDFVSSFNFKIEPAIYIQDLFMIQNKSEKEINNIFAFEKIIVQKIFDNQLVQKTKDDTWRLRYFDDIQYKPQYIRAVMFQLALKYRKAFYDFIYKSKKQAVTRNMFNDIMQSGILDDLSQDVYKNGQHSMNYKIKYKMNIWFSLYEFFGNNETKNGVSNMASKIKELQECMHRIVTNEGNHIETDEEFAYAAGQVIYYLLSCSEAGNKTHALLEPFLQKTDPSQFKMAISRTFNQYKHAISFYKGKFEKLMAEVLSYELKAKFKELIPFILAGYFAENIMYKKINN